MSLINKKAAILINSMGSGGSERMVSNLLKQAVANGYEISLICIEQDNFYPIPPEIKVYYLLQSKLKNLGILKFLLLPVLGLKLARLLKKTRLLLSSLIYI